MLHKRMKAVYKAIEIIEDKGMIGRDNIEALHEIYDYAEFDIKNSHPINIHNKVINSLTAHIKEDKYPLLKSDSYIEHNGKKLKQFEFHENFNENLKKHPFYFRNHYTWEDLTKAFLDNTLNHSPWNTVGKYKLIPSVQLKTFLINNPSVRDEVYVATYDSSYPAVMRQLKKLGFKRDRDGYLWKYKEELY